MIDIRHVTKSFGARTVLRDISFTVQKGEILGFLGRNGAGKTTTMNILTGYLSPDCGMVSIDGCDILEEPRSAKAQIGYLPEVPPLYNDMTVLEYLRFAAQIKGVPRASIKKRVDLVLEETGAAAEAHRLIRNLSKGYRQRIGVAQALIADPPILILDEPTSSLDPGQIHEMRSLIRQLGKTHTVVLSSHILHEIQEVCQRVAIIHEGRILIQDSLSHLTGSDGGSVRLQLRLGGNETGTAALLNGIHGLQSVRFLGSCEENTCDYLIDTLPGFDARMPVFYACAEARIPILMMKPMNVDLEEVFIQLTGTDGVDEK